jgi:hypothetical protein
MEISTSDQRSHPSRREIEYVLFRLPRVWNNGSSLKASDVMLIFFIWRGTFLFKNQAYMYNTNRKEWYAVVTHHSRVNVKWASAKACFYRIKTSKGHQNELKICSGNPNFFRSITGIAWTPGWGGGCLEREVCPYCMAICALRDRAGLVRFIRQVGIDSTLY